MAAASVLVMFALAAMAQDAVVIYRCTDKAGARTIQNDVPCPAGTRQEREVIESPMAPMASAYIAPAPPPPSPRASASGTQIVSAPALELAPELERLPLPALYQCRTWDDDRYLTDDADPAERCAPLQTVGIGGAQGVGAGAACEMVVDTCEQVPVEGVCEAWQRRMREAEAALRFGRYDSLPVAEAELERVAGIASRSGCGR